MGEFPTRMAKIVGYARVCHRQKDHLNYPRHADDKTLGRATGLADILSGRKEIIVSRV